MKKMLLWAGALALVFSPVLSAAQTSGSTGSFPGLPAVTQVPASDPTKPSLWVPGMATWCWNSATQAMVVCPVGTGGGGGGGGGDASAANQTSVQAIAGSDAAKAIAVQFLTGGKAFAVAQLDTLANSTINSATLNATYGISPVNGQSTAGFSVTGLTASAATLTLEASNDGTNWTAISGVLAGTGLTASTLTADGQFRANASGRRGVRLRVSTVGTGTITVYSNLSMAPFDPPSPARDSNGDLRTATFTVTPFYVSITANTSIEVLPALTTRVMFDIQCNGAAIVGLSRTHATLTSVTPSSGGVDLRIPATADTYFSPPGVSNLGVTGYATTTTVCWGRSYARQ